MDSIIYGVTVVCALIGFSIGIWAVGLIPFGLFAGVGFGSAGGLIGFLAAANCV